MPCRLSNAIGKGVVCFWVNTNTQLVWALTKGRSCRAVNIAMKQQLCNTGRDLVKLLHTHPLTTTFWCQTSYQPQDPCYREHCETQPWGGLRHKHHTAALNCTQQVPEWGERPEFDRWACLCWCPWLRLAFIMRSPEYSSCAPRRLLLLLGGSWLWLHQTSHWSLWNRAQLTSIKWKPSWSWEWVIPGSWTDLMYF